MFNFGGGSLQVAGNFTSSLPFQFTGANSSAIDTNNFTVTLSGSLYGTGGLTKTNSGMLVLTGNNPFTYSGSTTVSGGTLQVQKPILLPGYSTPGNVAVASGAMLLLNAGGAGEWNPTSGTGDTISTLADAATFASGAVLGIDTTDAAGGATISGAMSGSLGLTKFGSNTLTLTGNSTYSGPTVVSGGSLIVNGSLLSAGMVTVNAGAMLSGTGSLGSVTVNSSGMLFPGLVDPVDAGTLTAASVTLGNSTTLDESIGGISGQNTLLAVSGSLTLGTGGTLNILPGGPLPTGTYTLATAGSIGGSLSGWTITGLPAVPTISVTGGTLSLNYTAAPIAGVWTAAGGGSWNGATNWQNRWEPSFVGDSATFGPSIGSNAATITLDGNHTLSALSFSTTGGGSYTISTSSGDTARADAEQHHRHGRGDQQRRQSDGRRAGHPGERPGRRRAGGSLTFSGPISESNTGTNVTLNSGTLILSGSNSYSGSTTVGAGTLQLGSARRPAKCDARVDQQRRGPGPRRLLADAHLADRRLRRHR